MVLEREQPIEQRTDDETEEAVRSIFNGIGLILFIFFGFIPLMIALILTVLGTYYRWKARWLTLSGLLLSAVLGVFGFFGNYVREFIQLLKIMVDGFSTGNPSGVIVDGLLSSVPRMLPASFGVGILLAGIGIWLVQRRPELLRLPVKEPVMVEKTVSGRKLERLPAVENGVAIGVGEEGKPVILKDEELNMHTLICGATGAGKTNTLLVILESAIRRGKPVIVVDGKGDSRFFYSVRKMAEASGRVFQGFTYKGSTHYNPLRHGVPTELKDKLMGFEEWSEPYYKRGAERYLQTVFRVLQLAGERSDLHKVAELLETRNLMKKVKRLDEVHKREADRIKQYINGLDAGHRNAIEGLKDRLALLTESDVGPLFEDQGDDVIDLLEAVREKRVVMLSLSGLSYSSFTPALGAMVVEDLKTVAAALGEEGSGEREYIYIVLDEFNLFAGVQVVNLINKSRSAGFCCLIATQELADLAAAGGEELVAQVVGNTNVKIIHRQDVPQSAEYMSSVVGTRWINKKTLQTEESLIGRRPTRLGTVQQSEEEVIHPNILKQLRQGQAVVVKKVPELAVDKTFIRPAKGNI